MKGERERHHTYMCRHTLVAFGDESVSDLPNFKSGGLER